MKKQLLFWGILLAVLGGIYIIGKATHIIQHYSVPSGANEPAIKTGERIFASILKKPARFDLICYRAYTEYEGHATFVHRLCGFPGDLVEIRKGVLFVNSEDADKKLNLKLPYTIAIKDFAERNFEDYEHVIINADSAVVILETKDVTNNIKAVRRIAAPNEEVEEIKKTFSKTWNLDNFGPIRVPADHYFVLGDNRNGSMDSRFLGFIPVKDFVGTVLWK